MTRSSFLIVAPLAFGVAGVTFGGEGSARSVSGPSYSAVQQKIVFATNAFDDGEGCSDLWKVSMDGTGLTQLTSTPNVDEDYPSYSPNGAYIAYQRASVSDPPAASDLSVFVANADGSAAQQLNKASLPGFAAAWLSDSQRLVLATTLSESADLIVRGRVGTDHSVVAASCANESNPHCSADSTWVVYEIEPVSCQPCAAQGKTCSQIWKRNVSSMVDAVQLTSGHYADQRPCFSGDGSKIAFASDRDAATGHPSSVYAMNADGTALTRVNLSADAYDPFFLSDGRILLVLSEADSNAGGSSMNLAVVQADGSGLVRVTSTVASTVMSPNGGDPPPDGVTLSCATAGAVIHYTTDGSAPTLSSSTYSVPVPITQPTTLKAKAWKQGWLPSLTTERSFGEIP